MDREAELKLIIKSDSQLIAILKAVESLQLKDCWIAAGIIRNKVWDILHHQQTNINDIDVIYFDSLDRSIEKEKIFENQLHKIMPNQPWSVKNQARMHIKNNTNPYLSSEDGVTHFPEISTAIAVRIINDELEIMAPYGLEDLFKGNIRPTPPFKKDINLYSIYEKRIKEKNWVSIWGNLKVIK